MNLPNVKIPMPTWKTIAFVATAGQVATAALAARKLKKSEEVSKQNAHLVAEVLYTVENCGTRCSTLCDDAAMPATEIIRKVGEEFNFMLQVVGERLDTAEAINGELPYVEVDN